MVDDHTSDNRPVMLKTIDMINKHLTHDHLRRKYWQSRLLAPFRSPTFRNVENFVVFIGYARSGHSLVGSLLDAHPDMIIAHELDALFYLDRGFSLMQIYQLLLDNSYQTANKGRSATGYSYQVEGQWQGRYRKLRIIGDKKGDMTALRIYQKPSLLDSLIETIPVPIKFVHIVRNPLDNISTIAKRRDSHVSEEWVNYYFDKCRGVKYVKDKISSENFYELRSETLIANKHDELKKLVEFLGLEASEDYLQACTKIIKDSPSITRDNPDWTPELIEAVRTQMREFDFLLPYLDEGSV